MKKNSRIKVVTVWATLVVLMITGCGSKKSNTDKKVLRVGMECAYAPFNWTQDSATTPDGSKAEKIFGSDFYSYGYDVAVPQMIAKELGYELEIHKVEWSSIGISMEAGDYDCIIAGMGRTAERELSYSFTSPYYYRDNCIVVKKGSKYEGVKGLSELAGTGCRLTTQLGTGCIPLLDQIEGAVGDNTLGGTGNTVLDPAPDIRKTIADLFVAIVQIFSFLRNLFKI